MVSYSKLDKQRTTDVHLLAFNDLHGNLEAAGLNIYGKFAGGAAYLARAIKDRQARYGTLQATVMAATTSAPAPWPTGCSSRSRSPSPPT
jgi:5'-nucleotidase